MYIVCLDTYFTRKSMGCAMVCFKGFTTNYVRFLNKMHLDEIREHPNYREIFHNIRAIKRNIKANSGYITASKVDHN